MKVSEILERLKKDSCFAEVDCDRFFLAHIFHTGSSPIQVGYCRKETGTILSFEMGESIKYLGESDALKGETPIEELRLESVTLDLDSALELAGREMASHYPREKKTSELAVLQKVGNDTLYNITFFTASFRTVNIRIDAGSGNVLSVTEAPLVSF